ncbi:MAG: phospho-N-acetylmuramoyl-pentapeptide-transferase [Muribaculaceae bacterium]|nr:phospho-N-acetylmuramoyl-pentapeptide-transferase [Muribaculaceae bacterium]MBR0023794.1 phospho-N-acetylmuramoyl-pentapeptide-transferase [Muribaculaceae bacterium]
MLYYLFRFLEQYNIPGSHMWQYISFRALLTLILSLVLSAWLGEKFIQYMRKRKIGETQRDASIDPFGEKKAGTPSMGGIVIITAILLPVLLLGRMRNIYIILMIITTVWLGFLGFCDDYIKIYRKHKEGLKGKYKIVGQVSIGLIVGLVLWLSPDVVMHENVVKVKTNAVQESVTAPVNQSLASANTTVNDTIKETIVVHKDKAEKSLKTTIPFVKNHNLDYGALTKWMGDWSGAAGWALFVLMTILVVTAVSNGANLNDGMDGMCAGNSAIIGVALGILAYVSSNFEYASYLNIMYIPDSQELVVFMCAFIGALIGFLWYNAYPAQMFMGDTGSLTIGGIIGVCAVIIHKELLVPILCGVFLMESLTVIIQTQVYKLNKRKGKKVRVFRSTPIHDNFRKLDKDLDPECKYVFRNWPRNRFHESKITIRFWIFTILLAACTIITLKIR